MLLSQVSVTQSVDGLRLGISGGRTFQVHFFFKSALHEVQGVHFLVKAGQRAERGERIQGVLLFEELGLGGLEMLSGLLVVRSAVTGAENRPKTELRLG